MKIIKQLLFIAIITICTSFAALAQEKGDRRKTPPKDGTPPVVVAPPKKDERPKGDKPKNDDKPRRPQSMVFEVLQMTGIRFN